MYKRYYITLIVTIFIILGLNAQDKYSEIEVNLVNQFHYEYPSNIIGLTYDGEFIWFYDLITDSLIAINKETGKKEYGFPIPMLPYIYGLAFDGENFWASANQFYLYKIDHENGSIITSFHIPYSVATNACITGLTWCNNTLYCTYDAGYSSMILGIDVDNIICVDTLGTGGCGHSSGLTFFKDYFWINDYIDIKIRKLNPEYGQYEGWFSHYYLCYKLVGITNDGEYMYCSDNFRNIYKYEIIDTTVDIINKPNIVSNNVKINAYPNPTSNEVKIEFSLSEKSIINIDIFDENGRMVNNLITNRLFNKGKHFVLWNSTNISTGIYFIKLITQNNTYNQKLIIK